MGSEVFDLVDARPYQLLELTEAEHERQTKDRESNSTKDKTQRACTILSCVTPSVNITNFPVVRKICCCIPSLGYQPMAWFGRSWATSSCTSQDMYDDGIQSPGRPESAAATLASGCVLHQPDRSGGFVLPPHRLGAKSQAEVCSVLFELSQLIGRAAMTSPPQQTWPMRSSTSFKRYPFQRASACSDGGGVGQSDETRLLGKRAWAQPRFPRRLAHFSPESSPRIPQIVSIGTKPPAYRAHTHASWPGISADGAMLCWGQAPLALV